MIVVELYSKDDCHLCDLAKDVLMKVRQSYPFNLRVIKIREGDENYEEFAQRIPVVFINKEFAFQYHVSEKELIRKLGRASESVGRS